MKKNLLVSLGLAAVVVATSATAFGAFTGFTPAGQGISGSRHDINAFAASGIAGATVTADSQERVCAFCHTPHHAYTSDMQGAAAADYLPLWSHELTSKTYTGYASDTLNAVIGDPLIGPSRLCMSCHDGVIAVDTHYLNLGAAAPKTAQLVGDNFSTDATQSGAVGAGSSLAGDHPIGFDYIAAQAADAASGNSGGNAGDGIQAGIRTADNYFRGVNGVPRTIKIQDALFGAGGGTKTIMTCATCHDVHNKDNVVQTKADGSPMDVNYFLMGAQSGSQICLSCHNK